MSPLVINRVTTRLTSPRRLIPTCETKNTSKNSKERSSQIMVTNCWWMIKLTSWGFTSRRTATVRRQIELKQNPNPNEGGGYWDIEVRGVTPSLDMPLMGSTKIHGPKAKIRCGYIFWTPPSSDDSQQLKTNLGLKPTPYVDRRNRTLDVAGASNLLHAVPGLRGGLEIELHWASMWFGRPLLFLHSSMLLLMCPLVISLVPNHNIIIR
jgi:hypothetical protein